MSILQRQLAPGEELFDVKIDTSHLIEQALGPAARVHTLLRMTELLAGHGYTIVHGPEITEVHRPGWPGDATWMKAAAVVRSM